MEYDIDGNERAKKRRRKNYEKQTSGILQKPALAFDSRKKVPQYNHLTESSGLTTVSTSFSLIFLCSLSLRVSE